MSKVSIVLPTYNGKKYIRESIESIISQTFNDWELIIVDDCSTDGTLQIAGEYAENDTRIKIIHNEINKKLPTSLNIGFEYAKGNFLTWTSDDNCYLPKAIEKMYQYLCEKNVQMVCADMDIIDAYGNKTGNAVPYDADWMYCNNCVGACFMYKKQVLEEIGGYDSEKFLIEDYDYWMRVLKQYGKIGHINETLYLYRYHEECLTARKRISIRKKMLKEKNIEVLFEKLKENKACLCGIFFEYLEMDEDVSVIKSRFIDVIPELSAVTALDYSKKYIVYGAGQIGDEAYELLKDKIVYYVDSNENKIGKYKNNIRIISPAELRGIKDRYQIVIAVGNEKKYDVLKFLYTNGIKSIGFLNYIKWRKENDNAGL